MQKKFERVAGGYGFQPKKLAINCLFELEIVSNSLLFLLKEFFIISAKYLKNYVKEMSIWNGLLL